MVMLSPRRSEIFIEPTLPNSLHREATALLRGGDQDKMENLGAMNISFPTERKPCSTTRDDHGSY